jgi:hypothetical protein
MQRTSKFTRAKAIPRIVLAVVLVSTTVPCSAAALHGSTSFKPGARTVLDAHNCYPYEGKWSDRIERALANGIPIAIEQDLFWFTDPKTHQSRSVLAHTPDFHGDEPSLETYFFERIRPIVEAEMRHPNPASWPIITLNLDIKTEEYGHLRAIYKVLEQHREWLTIAINVVDPAFPQPLHPGPVLVLAGTSDRLEQVFRKEVPLGAPLLVFGAVHTIAIDAHTPPDQLEVEPVGNYRRWWNNSWAVVEDGGPSKAGEWTQSLDLRLRQIVQYAHAQGLWIRFYTLDGATPNEQLQNGWFKTYNFPSLLAARQRWQAAIDAGVDYLATDQYAQVKVILETASRDRR